MPLSMGLPARLLRRTENGGCLATLMPTEVDGTPGTADATAATAQRLICGEAAGRQRTVRKRARVPGISRVPGLSNDKWMDDDRWLAPLSEGSFRGGHASSVAFQPSTPLLPPSRFFGRTLPSTPLKIYARTLTP